ncbi:Protein transport protein S9 plasma membrane t-SNARE [Gnomoniopsis smithogilvyi]|uniref:Protein transport protein S9 plasma membrane t-SNARE n=1 Tax=Gnomoniopsis smithogilvyi TaxID=1191159 RepID=A0A9W8YZC9_9PEZI|nr:Protein transport protein S9 plasma membrane t-SNARE [Gnomoniopsis smithogilvyi]
MGLFNKKKKDAGSNPYAQDGAQVPYANPLTPYQQARNNMAQGQPVGLPTGPRMGAAAGSAPSMSSTSGSSSRFGDDKYGSSNGYGSDRYGSSTSSAPKAGGYGGFDDAGKSDLFAGASARYVPPQPNDGPAPAAQAPGTNRNPALFGNSQERYNPYDASRPQQPAGDDEYGGYGAPRELTEEEKQEQEFENTRAETKALRKEDIALIDRINATADNGLDVAFGTRLRLAEQEERLHNTEMKLDMADIHTKDGSDKTKTLDKLNRTPFFIPVGPGKKARNAQIEATMERGREERERREETRRDGFGNQVRMEETTKDLVRGQAGIKQIGGSGKKAAPNKKFVFVDDNGEFDQEEADDEELIQQGLEATFERTKMLNKVSNLMGEDIERSNARLDRIAQKTDTVDDRVRMNRARLNQIR